MSQCRRGHPEEEWVLRPDGRGRCRQCDRERKRDDRPLRPPGNAVTGDGGWPARYQHPLVTPVVYEPLADLRDANCVGEAPHLWDLDYYETTEEADEAGARLCRDCPMLVACAEEALVPLATHSREAGYAAVKMHGVIRAGVAMLYNSKSSSLRLRHVVRRGRMVSQKSGWGDKFDAA